MKRNLGANIPSRNLLKELLSKDSNSDRRRVVISSMNAVELGRERRFKDAIREMARNFPNVGGTLEKKKLAFASLCMLLSKYNTFKDQPLTTFHGILREKIRSDVARLSTGAAATFYGANTYGQIATGINIADDASLNRTIHRSKGDEFNTVLLILKGESELTFAVSPNLTAEQQRLYYVAISRARQYLFINVPSLDQDKRNRLTGFFHFQTV